MRWDVIFKPFILLDANGGRTIFSSRLFYIDANGERTIFSKQVFFSAVTSLFRLWFTCNLIKLAPPRTPLTVD